MAKTRTTSETLTGEVTEPQTRMGFGEHLEEFRKRLVLALMGAAVPIIFCLYKMNAIMAIITRPYRLALKAHGLPQLLAASKPQEVVLTYLGIGFKAGLIIASPWVIYQLWLFIAAGLYQKERKAVYKYIGPSAILFLLGVAFFYFLILPMTLKFFISFTDNTAPDTPQATWIEGKLGLGSSPPGIELSKIPKGDDAHLMPIPMVSSDPSPPPPGTVFFFYNATEGLFKLKEGDSTWDMNVAKHGSQFLNQPQLDEYISFVTFMTLLFGVSFELPMVILVLAQLSLVQVKTFRSVRKYAYLVIAVVAAVAAPSGDIMSMVSLMLPLIVLYEAGIIAAAIATRHRDVVAD